MKSPCSPSAEQSLTLLTGKEVAFLNPMPGGLHMQLLLMSALMFLSKHVPS